MRKIVARMGALVSRRKPTADKEGKPMDQPPAAPGADESPFPTEAPPPEDRAREPSPPPAHAVPAASVEPVPQAPGSQDRPSRAAPDLVFMLSGNPGQPGIDLSCIHADTGHRLREGHPEALYPDEVEGGDYILDVTGHALSFGPQGRPGAHVFVPVKTHKGSPTSMPRNATGNALVPIEARIVERIDRETAAVKVRLQRPVVAWISLRGGLGTAQAGPDANEPDVEALAIRDPVSVVGPDPAAPLAEGNGPRGGPGGTDEERHAQDGLSAMGFLLAGQAVASQPALAAPPAAAQAAAPDGLDGPEAGGKGEEWTPSGAYGR